MLCCGGRPDSGVDEAGERQTGRRQTGGAEKGWDLGMKGNGFWVEKSRRERGGKEKASGQEAW